MATITLFKNRFGAVNVSVKGKLVKFVSGKFFTQDKELEAALKEMAEKKDAGVYIDSGEPDIDTENAHPMAYLERQIREKVMKEIQEGKQNSAAQVSPGNSEQPALQNSTQNTMGTATAQGTPVAQKPAAATTATAKVSGAENTETVATPTDLEKLKSGGAGSTSGAGSKK